MDNYKIKVKDEAESKEAQELFLSWVTAGFVVENTITALATIRLLRPTQMKCY